MAEPERSDLLFEVATPLGFRVRVTRAAWSLVVSVKHPAMAGYEEDVKMTLIDPSEVRLSRKDSMVYLFYRPQQAGRWCCAVTKRLDEDGFPYHCVPR